MLSAADDTMQNDTADDIFSKGNKSYYKKSSLTDVCTSYRAEHLAWISRIDTGQHWAKLQILVYQTLPHKSDTLTKPLKVLPHVR